MSNPPKRLVFSYPISSKITQVIEEIIELTNHIYTPAELGKIVFSEYLSKLKSSNTDLTLKDIERIGWDNISTQELIDRYPPYRKQYQDAINNRELASPKAVDELEKELGVSLR